jgi:hypothetical protein
MRKLMLVMALSIAWWPWWWLAMSERVKQAHMTATTRVYR